MINIHPLTSDDNFSALVDEIRAAAWVAASEIDSSDYSVETIQKCIANQNHVWCIARSDGVFAGMASAFLMPKPDGDQWLYIDEVDVVADQQQKGVGTALMRFLIEYGKSNNCDEVWLGTEHNNQAANALYESLDPSEIEDFVGYTFKL